jgi:hypothetical protein
LEVNPSDDHFHLTIRLTFNNDADFNTYDNDPLVLTHRAAENAYYEQNGVVSNRTVTRS